MAVNPIPDDYPQVIPYLTVNGAADAIAPPGGAAQPPQLSGRQFRAPSMTSPPLPPQRVRAG